MLALDDHERLAALRTLLARRHDRRAAAARRLPGRLYAQPAARIVRLTTADLTLTDNGAQIRLGDDPIPLPARAARCRRRASSRRAERPHDPWLFAGQKAGQPMHPAHLPAACASSASRSPRPAPSALAALAHRIPAPVLADLLGLSAHTTANASGQLKVDYATYVARRTSRRSVRPNA